MPALDSQLTDCLWENKSRRLLTWLQESPHPPAPFMEGRISWERQARRRWDCSYPPVPWHASSSEQQWLPWPLLSCCLAFCLVTPPGKTRPGNSEKQPCLVSLGQVPLSSVATHQGGPNSSSPWGLPWDSYFPLGGSQAGRFQLPSLQAIQLSLTAFFLRMTQWKKGALFIARFPPPSGNTRKLNVSE